MSGRVSDAVDAAPPRQRTSTLRRSCEACRNVKARCIVEPTEAGRSRCCKRCANHNIECVFENALARPKKLKYAARTRVRDVEDKLNGLIALLSARKEAAAESSSSSLVSLSAPTATTSPLGALPAPVYVNYDLSSLPGLAVGGGTHAAPTPAASSLLQLTAPGGGGDVIDRGLVSEQTASASLSAFMQSSEKQFPFVLLPAYATLGYMRRARPFALLAVLTVTADPALQMRLALEYRKTLAQAIMVEAKSSLDLLQSILIFCVWHHEYFAPYNSQLYQLSQTAVSMAVELNLPNTIPPRARTSAHRAAPTEQMASDIERARTFLGTYCLSASIAAAQKKQTQFMYDRRMDQAVQFLAAAQDRPSDSVVLAHHVQMRKLAEDVQRVFGTADQQQGGGGGGGGGGGSSSGGSSIGIGLDAAYIETMVKDFERQYKQLQRAMPAELWDDATLRCSMMYLPVVIYEVALRIPPEHKPLLQQSPTTANCCSWCASSARLALLLKCIGAAQAYINCYLALPLDEARRVTIFEVGSHVDAVLTLSRAGLSLDTQIFYEHGSSFLVSNGRPSTTNLLAMANIARYVAASERKMAALVAMDEARRGSVADQRHSLFWQLRYIFELGLAWYHKRVHAPVAAGCNNNGNKNNDKNNTTTTSNYRPCDFSRVDGSPIDWISKGASYVVQCANGRPPAAEPAEIPCGSGSGDAQNNDAQNNNSGPTGPTGPMGSLPEAQNVDELLQSLGPCMPQRMEAAGSMATTATTATTATATTDLTDPTDPVTSSDTDLPSAQMITPESDGSGFDYECGTLDPTLDPALDPALDPTLGTLSPWSMDQTAELFASIPPSMAAPWFPF